MFGASKDRRHGKILARFASKSEKIKTSLYFHALNDGVC